MIRLTEKVDRAAPSDRLVYMPGDPFFVVLLYIVYIFASCDNVYYETI